MCKGKTVDYVKKDTGERVQGVQGIHIIKTSEGINSTKFYYSITSPDYQIVQMMKFPTLCSCDQEQIKTRDGDQIKYYDLQAIEEIDLMKYFVKKSK